ncbi:hypothetical protein Q7P37_010024 [Cladosporium fusiforme]
MSKNSKLLREPFALPGVVRSIERDDKQSSSSQNTTPLVPRKTSTRTALDGRIADNRSAAGTLSHQSTSTLLSNLLPTSQRVLGQPEQKGLPVRPRLTSMLSGSQGTGVVGARSALNGDHATVAREDARKVLELSASKAAKIHRQVIDLSDDDTPGLPQSSTSNSVTPAVFGLPLRGEKSTLKRSHAAMVDSYDGEGDLERALGRSSKVPRLTTVQTAHESRKIPQAPKPENASAVIDLTGPSPDPQPATETYLHRLPAELRNRIYRDVGLKSQRLDLSITDEPALTEAIPDLRDELHSIIFSENKLRVNVYTTFNQSPSFSFGPMPRTPPEVGKIDLPPDHWTWKVDPRFVNIKHICFRVRQQSDHTLLFNLFANVKMDNGKIVAKGRMDVRNQDLRRPLRPLGDLARAKLKLMATREGFEGLSWADAQDIAACFVSVEEARTKFTKKYGQVTLK